MNISVIIPVFRGERLLPGLLASIAEQTVQCAEVWVVETDPSERVRALADECGARYAAVAAGDFDHAGTRTAIAKRTNGDILIFLTQDVLPQDEKAIARLIEPFEENATIAATYGRQVPDDGAHPFSVIKRKFNYPDRSVTKSLDDVDRLGLRTISLSNAFAAYRRSALAEVGWFSDHQLMCEDVTAAAKLLLAGYRIRYAAEAVVLHTHDLGWATELRRYFDIGVAHRQQEWIRDRFGRPTREGLRYLNLGVRQLISDGRSGRLPEFFLRCLSGNLAYTLGRHHDWLPRSLRSRCSSFPMWWQQDPAAGQLESGDRPHGGTPS